MKSRSFLQSLRHAGRGIVDGWRTGRNLRIQAFLGFCAVGLGLFVGLSPLEWAVLSLMIGVVLAAELANTAIENAVDLASPEYHELARLAKDMAAGAVLLLALTSLAVGAWLFVPKLLQ